MFRKLRQIFMSWAKGQGKHPSGPSRCVQYRTFTVTFIFNDGEKVIRSIWLQDPPPLFINLPVVSEITTQEQIDKGALPDQSIFNYDTFIRIWTHESQAIYEQKGG
jgi:hypothetical protein